MAIDLSGLIPGLAAAYEAIGEEVTFSRPRKSDSSAATVEPWTTFALFEWNKSVLRDGAWHKALVIYVPGNATYTPKSGDELLAGDRPWKVNAVSPHATGLVPFGWAVELKS